MGHQTPVFIQRSPKRLKVHRINNWNWCQIEFCQSNDDCKAFIYNSAESELQCHIFNKNLNWESCEKVGAYISDNINTCRNEPGHHSPLGCEVNKEILFRRNCKGIFPKRKNYFFSDICRRRLHIWWKYIRKFWRNQWSQNLPNCMYNCST